MRLIYGSGGNECTCEARVRAFLRLLKWTEGTEKEGDDAYRTLFSFKKFDDYSKYPMETLSASGYDSSAAGAYQINIACYKTLQGYYKNDADEWIQNKKKDYITKYKLNGFTPLEQDKLALLILIHKRKGLINDIINKEFSKGLRQHASYEWASMPPKRYNQPVKSFEEVAKRYKKYFEEELEGNTNLHLKEGFLKEFGIKCNCESSIGNEDHTCGKEYIDLTDKMIFYDQGSGNSNCNLTCKAIMSQMGVIAEGTYGKAKIRPTLNGSYYQLAEENLNRDGFVYNDTKSKEGIEYMDKALAFGHPVLLGVHHTYKYRKFGTINEDSTDHYVIVVGRKCLDGKTIYIYWDVGTQYGGKGNYYFVLENNRLTSTSRSTLEKKKDYIVTQIRRNKNEKGFVKYT